jgi:ribosomal-protein-alanine N-acetyltransferase
VHASRTLHRPWVSPPSTPAQFRHYLARMDTPGNCAWLICLTDTDAIAGVVDVTNIVRGVFRSAYLGYYAFSGFERRGLMRDGLHAVIGDAFTGMKLHRLEANVQPANAASLALVRACGFSREGYSPRYLKIRGRWRDHERWAILAS